MASRATLRSRKPALLVFMAGSGLTRNIVCHHLRESIAVLVQFTRQVARRKAAQVLVRSWRHGDRPQPMGSAG